MPNLWTNRENGWTVELIAESQGTCRYRLLGNQNQGSLKAGVIYSIAASVFRDWYEQQQPNARLWHYVSGAGYVKLTMRPGESITIRSGGPTDEGYSYTEETYDYDVEAGTVTLTTDTRARDCDGPLDTLHVCSCPIDQLHARSMAEVFDAESWPEEHKAAQGIYTPNWQRLSASQRDYYAESMNY